MSDRDLRRIVVDALASVAPELDETSLVPDQSFRDQLDIDSMDFLNYVITLHEALNIDIPESDYVQVSTIDGAVAFLSKKLASAKS
jgi:acyl carrier protein